MHFEELAGISQGLIPVRTTATPVQPSTNKSPSRLRGKDFHEVKRMPALKLRRAGALERRLVFVEGVGPS